MGHILHSHSSSLIVLVNWCMLGQFKACWIGWSFQSHFIFLFLWRTDSCDPWAWQAILILFRRLASLDLNLHFDFAPMDAERNQYWIGKQPIGETMYVTWSRNVDEWLLSFIVKSCWSKLLIAILLLAWSFWINSIHGRQTSGHFAPTLPFVREYLTYSAIHLCLWRHRL